MGGTKIFVLQMKQIRKIMLVAAAAVVALLIMMFLFNNGAEPRPTAQPMPQPPAPMQPQAPPRGMGAQAGMLGVRYVPGTYFSEIELANSTVIVSVEVSETAILGVSISDSYEAQQVFYPLMQSTMDDIAAQILATQSLDVEASAGTPYTQEVLISAIRSALEAARAR
ncbi:MAG: hypothetical protein FWD96_00310 [Defluviitaleaceae bacterium]|nr:hypothetical protein [Defluviitaleaceae bacterium]